MFSHPHPRLSASLPTLALTGIAAAVTLSSTLRAQAEPAGTQAFQPVVTHAPALPRAVASFGAARSGGAVYVQGGHVGRAHAHSRDNMVGDFYRLDLAAGGAAERLPDGPAVQGTALVAWNGQLFSIGGMTARNAPDEDDDLYSQRHVQRFDPSTNRWHDETPLPEPRSSHDACVVGHHVYVIGGWDLSGTSAFGSWHETAWRADLTKSPLEWQPIAEPDAPRRALAVAALGSKVVAVGGMNDEDEVLSTTSIYDPATDTWSAGPAWPGMGFGLGAIAHGDSVFASGMDGEVRRLDANATAWKSVGRLFLPRFFHRLVPGLESHSLLVLGGASRLGHLRTGETVLLDREHVAIQTYGVATPATTRNRHGIIQRTSGITLFGGNSSLDQHAFERENFSTSAYRIDYATMRARPIADFAVARQSFQIASAPDGARHLILGGFGPDLEADGDIARCHAEAWEFDPESDSFQEAAFALPRPRTQFGTAWYDGKVFVFGGTDYDPRREEDFQYPTDIAVLDTANVAAGFRSFGTAMPPRRAFASATIDHRVFVFGGMREGFEIVDTCDVLDLETGEWSTLPTPPRPRISGSAVVLGRHIALVGGSSLRDDGDIAPEPAIDVFDTVTGTWSQPIRELPFSTRHMRAFARGDSLVLFTAHVPQAHRAVLRAIRLPGISGHASAVDAAHGR